MYKINVLYREKGDFRDTIYYKGKFYKDDRYAQWFLNEDILYCHKYGSKIRTIYNGKEVTKKWYITRNGKKKIKSKEFLIIHCGKKIKFTKDGIFVDSKIVKGIQNVSKISKYGNYIIFCHSLSISSGNVMSKLDVINGKSEIYPVGDKYVASFDNNDWLWEEEYIVNMIGKKLHIGKYEMSFGYNGKILRYDGNFTEVIEVIKCPIVKKGFEDVILILMK